MKKSKILKLFSLAAFAMAGAFALASAKGSEKAEVKADTDVNYGNSGKIMLQLNTNEWKSSGSQIGLYMFNNDVGKHAWGNLVTPSGTSRFVEYSYSLDFTPKGCIAFRFDPGVEVMGDWCWENDRGNSAIWSTTNDIDFNNVVWLGNYYPSSKWTESGSYDLNAVVKGGATDDWSSATVDTRLTNVKVNGSDNLEVYGEVTLPAGTYFKVVKGGSTWCGTYSAHSSIEGNLSGGGSSNIHNTAAAKYQFYFDYDGESVYITDPVLAEADEWAQEFLSVNCQATMAQWSVQGARFNAMSSDAKTLLANEAHIAHDATPGSYVESAVQRYDYVIELYGTAKYSDFMGRVAAGKISSGTLAGVEMTISNNDSSNLVVIVSVVALISATSLVGLIVIKKRRSIAK